MNMAIQTMEAVLTAAGLAIDGRLFTEKLPLSAYDSALGAPSRTIEAGPPAPVGHHNNQVHVFDQFGVYLTEHHATHLIESVNFILDVSESPFPIELPFTGKLNVFGNAIYANMRENDFAASEFTRDLPGEYSIKSEDCWVGISAVGRRSPNGKRMKPRYVVRVSVCF